MKFVAGLIVGVLLVVGGGYVYFTQGYAPVATADAPMPFEKMLARQALHARLDKEMPANTTLEPTETNLLAGATLYLENCAVCHGLPDQPESHIAAGMFPRPPQMFYGKGVTTDKPGSIYWKVSNGIRLSGMPGFNNTLKEDQIWQICLLLENAQKLPPSVKTALAAPAK